MEVLNLRLNLEYRWYDMIVSGQKKEEYRKLKYYWFRRLFDTNFDKEIIDKAYSWEKHYTALYVLSTGAARKYDTVTFVRGYSKTERTYKFIDLDCGLGNPDWGAPENEPVFIIRFQ